MTSWSELPRIPTLNKLAPVVSVRLASLVFADVTVKSVFSLDWVDIIVMVAAAFASTVNEAVESDEIRDNCTGVLLS